jgi:multiple sugar transport system permease protein
MATADVPAAGGSVRRRRGRLRRQEILWSWIFLSPWVIGFVVFTAGPMVASLALSFTRYDVLNPPRWVGLANWATLMTDGRLHADIWNTFFFAALHVPLAMAVALGLSLLLDRVGRGAGIFRTAFYLPSVTPAVAIGILWFWLLNPQFGLVNAGLRLLHLPGPGWTTDPFWVKPGLVVMSLWGLGNTIVIYFAALRQVPNELYEAAGVDGARGWQQFRHVTLPMISSAIFYTLVIGTITTMQTFDQIYAMYFGTSTNTAVQPDSEMYVIYLFRQAFEYFHMGYASALAWLLFVIILVMTYVQFRFSRRFVHYEGDA